MEKQLKPHSLKIENEKISVSGVVAVDEFSDKEIKLRLATDTLTLKGVGFVLEDTDVNAGQFIASGKVSDAFYRAKFEKSGLLNKIFK